MTDKSKFITRLIVFLVFSIIAPCVYIAIRFSLFKAKTSLSFWAIIIIAIIFMTFIVMIKFYLDGMKTKWSFIKQILTGFIKVIIPLLFCLILTVWLKVKAQWLLDNMNLIIETLSIIIGCEIIAIIVNPLSKWAFDNNVKGLVEITDKIFHKGEE